MLTLTFILNRPDCIVAKVWDTAAGHADSGAFTAVEIRAQKRYGADTVGAAEITHSSNQYTPQQAAAFAGCLAYAAAVAPCIVTMARMARIAAYPDKRKRGAAAFAEAAAAGDKDQAARINENLIELDAQQAADTAAGA